MQWFDVSVYVAKKDFLGVKSVAGLDYATYSEGFYSWLGIFYWHKGLSLFSSYSKGDTVIVNGNPRIINYMLLLLLCRFRGIQTVWWGHGWSAGSYGFSSKIRMKIMKLAHKRLFYTDAELNKINIPNSYALNNGLDSSSIKQAVDNSGIVRAFDSGYCSLVFIGRLTEKSNFKCLLEALPIMSSNVRLNVIGDGVLLREFMDYADSLNVSDKIFWHGAIFDEEGIADIMLGSHAFVYPGAVGLSLIHAFNYGLPCIVHSDYKLHMPEYAAFEHKVNGLSFIYNDCNSLASAVDEFSDLTEENKVELSNQSFRTINRSYNVESMASRFIEMLEGDKSK
jgi:glycosyltransferase involved in cell wall biosynthesis